VGQVVYSPNYKAFVTLASDVDKQTLPVQSEEYADLMGTVLMTPFSVCMSACQFIFCLPCLYPAAYPASVLFCHCNRVPTGHEKS